MCRLSTFLASAGYGGAGGGMYGQGGGMYGQGGMYGAGGGMYGAGPMGEWAGCGRAVVGGCHCPVHWNCVLSA